MKTWTKICSLVIRPLFNCALLHFAFLSGAPAVGQAQEFFVSAISSGEIFRSPIENPSATMVRNTFNTTATALTVHSVRRQLFVFDIEPGGGAIRTYEFDGTGETLILSGIIAPLGIAIDSVNDKIYFSSGTGPVIIERCNLDGSARETVVIDSTPSVDLINLQVDPAGGKIYWVQAGTNDFIVRADLADGGNQQTIVNVGNSDITTAIALDTTNSKIYYGSDSTDEIKRANLDGSNQETVVSASVSANPTYLEVDPSNGPTIYWVDNFLDEVRSHRLSDGVTTTLLSASLSGLPTFEGFVVAFPSVLTPITTIDIPPAVNLISGTRKVELTFQAFDGIDLTESVIFAKAISPATTDIFRYDATIRNSVNNRVKRIVTANAKATVQLPPGNYTASYVVRFGERRSNKSKKTIIDKAKAKIADLKARKKTTSNLNKIEAETAKKLLAVLKPLGATNQSPSTEVFTIPN